LAATIVALARGQGEAGIDEIRGMSSVFAIRQRVASEALRDGDAA
jgi:hypothetical protein